MQLTDAVSYRIIRTMNEYKTVHLAPFKTETVRDEKTDKELTNTLRLNRKAVLEPIKVEHHAYLEISWGGEETIGVELAKDKISVGRHPSCDIPIPLTNISREHSRFLYNGSEYYIEDLNSTNGTYVNGVRIVKCILRNNDQIQIGDAKILFIEEKTRQR